MKPIFILLGILTITSYRSVPEQTKGKGAKLEDCFYTSIGHRVSEDGCAVSPDLLTSGRVHYGDSLYIDGVGYRVVNDITAPRLKNWVDVWVSDYYTEKQFGIKRRRVWVGKLIKERQ